MKNDKLSLGERIALLGNKKSEAPHTGKEDILNTLHALAEVKLDSIYHFYEPDAVFMKDPWKAFFTDFDEQQVITVDPDKAEKQMNLAEFEELLRVNARDSIDAPYFDPGYKLFMDILLAVATERV